MLPSGSPVSTFAKVGLKVCAPVAVLKKPTQTSRLHRFFFDATLRWSSSPCLLATFHRENREGRPARGAGREDIP